MDSPSREYVGQRFGMSFGQMSEWLRAYNFPLYARFYKATEKEQDIIYFGISRHLYYCQRLNPGEHFHDVDALREILEDALKGKNVALFNHIDVEMTDYSIADLGGLGRFAGVFQEPKRDTMRKRQSGKTYAI